MKTYEVTVDGIAYRVRAESTIKALLGVLELVFDGGESITASARRIS